MCFQGNSDFKMIQTHLQSYVGKKASSKKGVLLLILKSVKGFSGRNRGMELAEGSLGDRKVVERPD